MVATFKAARQGDARHCRATSLPGHIRVE
jgi:hypothetical protein